MPLPATLKIIHDEHAALAAMLRSLLMLLANRVLAPWSLRAGGGS